MSRRCSLLFTLFAFLAWTGSALAITGGVNIGDAEFPSAGIVLETKFDAAGEKLIVAGWGSGTLIETNRFSTAEIGPHPSPYPEFSWVLTAAHVVSGRVGDVFRPQGASGTNVTVAEAFIHPGFVADKGGLIEDNDIALLRLDSWVEEIDPSPLLRREIVWRDKTLRLAGFGLAQVQGDVTDLVDFPKNFQKRKGDFQIDAISAGNKKIQAIQKAPLMLNGDSGGPMFMTDEGGEIAAIAESSDNDDDSYGTFVGPYLNWIDSYTRGGVFWDGLKITGAKRFGGTTIEKELARDKFEGSYSKGLAPGWEYTAVSGYGGIGVAVDQKTWRAIDAIAFDNDGLEGDPKTSQGMVALGYVNSQEWAAIKKTFTFEDEWQQVGIEIDQRFNSFGMFTDIGLQAGDGDISWAGMVWTEEDTLNEWKTRSKLINPGDKKSLTVYLVHGGPAVIPEPTAVLMILLGAMAVLARRGRG